ncbi:MAG: hypothetical protein ABL895_20650 [Cyclobacteriaceae bacterium]
MLTFKKRLATIIFLTLFSAATLVSCGKQGNKEDHPAGEHPADSTEHPADSTEHPSDSTKQASEHPEHPTDSTKN